MSAQIYLSHAAIGALLLFVIKASSSLRERVLAAACGLGATLGLAFVFSSSSDEIWRTAGFTGAVACVGAAIVCSWALTGVDFRSGRWQTGVLIGVAASGAALAAGNGWIVPAILFWLCSSLAVAALSFGSRGRLAVWLALFVSDALLIAGLIGYALDSESWRVPDALDGWPLVVVLASAVVRSGAIPKTGLWGALDSEGAKGLPLMVAGSFVAVTWALGDPVPWLGVGLVVVAIFTALWGLARRHLSVPSVGAVPVALGLGAAVAEPGAAIAAGVASVISVTLVALWPAGTGRAEVPRALHLAFVPPTIGFVAVVTAAVAAFDRAIEAERIADTLVNTLFSALLPVALAVSVALAARIARAGMEAQLRPAEGEVEPAGAPLVAGASWALLAASVAMTLLPPDVLGLEGQPLGSTEARILLAVAVLVGGAAALLSRERSAEAEVTPAGVDEAVSEISFTPLVPRTENRLGKVLGYVAVLLVLALVVSVGWFTVYGMSLGFL